VTRIINKLRTHLRLAMGQEPIPNERIVGHRDVDHVREWASSVLSDKNVPTPSGAVLKSRALDFLRHLVERERPPVAGNLVRSKKEKTKLSKWRSFLGINIPWDRKRHRAS
jgi:hypothetical protein